MGIFTGDFTAETGTVTVEIDGDSGGSYVSGSGTFRVLNIGKLEFSNEVPQKDEANPNSIITKQGGIQIDVWDILTNGNSLFSYLNELNVGERLNCKLIVNGLETLLALGKTNIKYNARTQYTTINFVPRIEWVTNPEAVAPSLNLEFPIADVPTNFYVTPPTYNTYDTVNAVLGTAYTAHDLVSGYLQYVYGSGYTTYVRSSSRVLTASPTGRILATVPTGALGRTNGDQSVFIDIGTNYGVLGNVSRIAALEGSTFGSAFSVNYYINRLDLGSDATATFRPEINYNFVQELEVQNNLNIIANISGVLLGSEFNNQTSGTATGLSIDLNDYGTQNFNLNWNGVSTTYAVWNLASVGAVSGAFDYDNTVTRNLAQDAVNNGIRAYSKALDAESAQRVKFKFRNALSLKPYQAFTLSSGAPAVFRASGSPASSVVYRPSRLFYDFKGDFIEGEAYAIGAV